jgi:hypothetical protein
MLMSKAEIAMMKKESLLNDVRLLTNQETIFVSKLESLRYKHALSNKR